MYGGYLLCPLYPLLVLLNQQHKPLRDGESVQPSSLLFHEQRPDVKLQPSTRIANSKIEVNLVLDNKYLKKQQQQQQYFLHAIRILIPEI